MINSKEIARIAFLLILAILYFVIPFDIIPDALGRIGKLDDIVFLLIIIWWNFFKPLFDEIQANSKKQTKNENFETNELKIEKINCSAEAYRILNIEQDSSLTEIKKAYLELIKQYHPDKVDNLGKELKVLAQNKTALINQAYEFLIKNEKID